MSCARSDGNRDRIRMGASLESEVDDAPDDFIVTETGGAAGAGKSAGGFRQIAVGVHVDDVGGAVGREANVQAAVVAQLHRRERARAPRDSRRAATLPGRPAHGTGFVPRYSADVSSHLRRERYDTRPPDGHLREIDLVQRQQIDAAVATPEHRHVDLASLDVALDQRGLTVARDHRGDLALEVGAIVHDRLRADAGRTRPRATA